MEPAPTSPPAVGPAVVAPSAEGGPSASMVQQPAQHPADALADAASPPASAPPVAVNETPSAAATPQQPPTPHKGPVNGAGPSQRGGSVSPCVTDAAARLSLQSPQSPSSRVRRDAMPGHHARCARTACILLFHVAQVNKWRRSTRVSWIDVKILLQIAARGKRCLAPEQQQQHQQRAAAPATARRAAL